ncbi:YfcE family phosphodiesterase [Brucepastera parasyntrophica]|uniref:YfcE family phosphodiesterase n=1 Tax=Brucepastera parasyntrophica TaxID=2880008 RepID=UPI00210A0786|nr:YfcE family phosphodiesterase [Brucepastera parasyntrophica]ULQ60968.1 YfcE family phosphodiesterase [Brucepastera parasyntrophica]
MNELVQQESGLLGSEEAIERLAGADTAVILIVSDTHGDYEAFEYIVRKYGSESDALLFAGDGIWDIVQYIENAQISEKLYEALPPVVAFVAGNGDADQYRVRIPVGRNLPLPEEAAGFTLTVPARQKLSACGYGIFLVHGHRHSVDFGLEMLIDAARAMDSDIAVFGHTHVPFIEQASHILLLNPGSPSRPRSDSDCSFALLELDAASITPEVKLVTMPGRF